MGTDLMKKVEKIIGLLKIHGALVMETEGISKLKWAVMFVELRMMWFMLIWWAESQMKNQKKVPQKRVRLQNLQKLRKQKLRKQKLRKQKHQKLTLQTPKNLQQPLNLLQTQFSHQFSYYFL